MNSIKQIDRRITLLWTNIEKAKTIVDVNKRNARINKCLDEIAKLAVERLNLCLKTEKGLGDAQNV